MFGVIKKYLLGYIVLYCSRPAKEIMEAAFLFICSFKPIGGANLCVKEAN
jgi:hypothetical protein